MSQQPITSLDINTVQLIGRVVCQPELSIIPLGATLYVMISLHIRAAWPDHRGEVMAITYGIPCFAQGPTAEALLWIAEGDTVNIQGSLDLIVGEWIPAEMTFGHQLAVRIHNARLLTREEMR